MLPLGVAQCYKTHSCLHHAMLTSQALSLAHFQDDESYYTKCSLLCHHLVFDNSNNNALLLALFDWLSCTLLCERYMDHEAKNVVERWLSLVNYIANCFFFSSSRNSTLAVRCHCNLFVTGTSILPNICKQHEHEGVMPNSPGKNNRSPSIVLLLGNKGDLQHCCCRQVGRECCATSSQTPCYLEMRRECL